MNHQGVSLWIGNGRGIDPPDLDGRTPMPSPHGDWLRPLQTGVVVSPATESAVSCLDPVWRKNQSWSAPPVSASMAPSSVTVGVPPEVVRKKVPLAPPE